MELTRRGAIRLAGAAGLAAAAGAVLSVAPASPALADQNGWRWCRQCQGLWFPGNPAHNVCPAYGVNGHSLTGSGNYTLPLTSDVFNGDQDGWFWCAQCAGLWFGLSPTTGECPAPTPGTTGHEFRGSTVYSLHQNGGRGQSNWRWCQDCQGLWFAGNGTSGKCPARARLGLGHNLAGSGNYHIDVN